MNDLPFLTDEKDMAEAQPVAETPAPEPVAPSQGEPEPAAPPAAQPEEAKHIPISALLDEREKRQKFEREAEELRRWKAEQEQRQRQQAAPKIDVLDDPEGFARQQQQMLQQAILQDRYERSLDAAVEKHGQDTVKAVVDFFNDPAHAPKTHEFIRHPDPFKAAFKYYQEQREIAEIRGVGGVEAMRAKIEAELREKLLAEVQPPAPKAPPPSMAATPGTSGGVKDPTASGFASLFERE